jgi:DNA modification methylase
MDGVMKPYYEDDSCVIYHADCREILPHLSGITCIVTSPPYNQLGSRIPLKPTGSWADSHGGAGFVQAIQSNGYADDMDERKYQEWQVRLFSDLASACTDSASLFYNHQLRWRDKVCLHPIQWFSPSGWDLRQEMIWDRGGGI